MKEKEDTELTSYGKRRLVLAIILVIWMVLGLILSIPIALAYEVQTVRNSFQEKKIPYYKQ